VIVPVDPCDGGMCMRSQSVDVEGEHAHFKGICCEDVAEYWQTDTPKSSEKISLSNAASGVFFQQRVIHLSIFWNSKIYNNLFSRPPPSNPLFIVFQNFRL
jgi:hypothetical protein